MKVYEIYISFRCWGTGLGILLFKEINFDSPKASLMIQQDELYVRFSQHFVQHLLNIFVFLEIS